MQTQLNFETTEAIQRAIKAQERRVTNWGDDALNFLRNYAQQGFEFITEDVRDASLGFIDEPVEPRAWGAVIRAAIRQGIIKWTGKYQTMNNPKSHDCPKKVWVRG